jgi:hypothetical protein
MLPLPASTKSLIRRAAASADANHANSPTYVRWPHPCHVPAECGRSVASLLGQAPCLPAHMRPRRPGLGKFHLDRCRTASFSWNDAGERNVGIIRHIFKLRLEAGTDRRQARQFVSLHRRPWHTCRRRDHRSIWGKMTGGRVWPPVGPQDAQHTLARRTLSSERMAAGPMKTTRASLRSKCLGAVCLFGLEGRSSAMAASTSGHPRA